MSKTIEPNLHVIGIHAPTPCPSGGCPHISGLQLASGDGIALADALSLMDAGRDYFMIPPPGAPAHAAHVATGLPLVLQATTCDACGERVLFA